MAPLLRPVPIPPPFQSAAPINLNYWGGPIMPFTENAIVLWGSAGHTSSLTAGLPGFLAAFASTGNANPYDIALEYRTLDLGGTNQPLTLGSRYLGSFAITPTTQGTDLSDSEVAAQLVTQIGAGALPPPRVAFGGPVSEYYVMFPPSYSVCLTDGSCSDAQFCAYHSDAVYHGTPFTYVVLPESTPPDPGCGANWTGDGFGNLTSMASHEMVESMTDPEVGSATVFGPPLAWYDQHNGEVADICNAEDQALTFGGGTWVVQKEWSNAEHACIASHASAGLKGVLATIATSGTAGSPVGFDASGSSSPNGIGAISTYAWDWGDGTSSNGTSSTATHAYATPGTRLVTMIATDASGAGGAAFLNVTTRSLRVGTSGNGLVASASGGIACPGTCSANFLDRATVSLTARPGSGATFSGWTGDCAGQPAACIVTMGGARTATANFTSGAPPPAPPPPPPSPPPSPPPPPPPPVCAVPNVLGQTLSTARTRLLAAHCKAGLVTLVFSKTVSKGRVVSQSAAAGRHLANGAAVNLAVSKGPRQVRVVLCYRYHTLHVTKAVAKKLRKSGATLGRCRPRR